MIFKNDHVVEEKCVSLIREKNYYEWFWIVVILLEKNFFLRNGGAKFFPAFRYNFEDHCYLRKIL